MTTPPIQEVHWKVIGATSPNCTSLDSDISSDVVIVGGGLTGCRTALDLADAGTDVTLLEARDIGWGASGRSGGQCNPIWRETPDELVKRFGANQASNLINTTISAADDLFSDITKFEIDCDGVQNGWLQTAHTRAAKKALTKLAAGWTQAGAKIDIKEGHEVASISGSPEYKFGLFHKSGGHVQPYSLTLGYAKAAQARGAKLFRNSAVTGVEKVNGKWRVTTANGSVTAEKVILTTNGYTEKQPLSGLQKTFLPLISIAAATAPLSAELRASVLPNSVTISDSRLAIYFARYDRDGRLIFGCVGSTNNVGTLGGHNRLRNGINTVFPQLEAINIERTWAGQICVTPEMMPHIYEPAPGLFAALGFSGRGIAMTSVMGRTLAAKALGKPDNEHPFQVLQMNSIPLHGLLKTLLPLGAPAMTIKDKIDTVARGL